jgi:hypothetical protein
MLSLSRGLLAASLLVMAGAPAPARAHGETRADVRVVLDGVEPSVAGLRVQVYDDHLAPQIVLENTTGRALEILDPQGRPFVRVDARGVEADFAAAAWYESLSPGGAPVPAAARAAAAEPAWRRVRSQPSWGWFDPRLQKEHLERPDAHAGVAVLRRWTVPARLGGQALQIRGHFLYTPAPSGIYLPRLTSGSRLAPDVHVVLSPGRPPALLLENRGADDVIVLGAHDEPFLRIGAGGVDANLASPTWQDLGRYRGAAADGAAAGDGAPQWTRVSLAPRYSWPEPRAGMPSVGAGDVRPPDNMRSKAKGWQVPVLIGGQRVAIQGVVEWVPASTSAAAAGRMH